MSITVATESRAAALRAQFLDMASQVQGRPIAARTVSRALSLHRDLGRVSGRIAFLDCPQLSGYYTGFLRELRSEQTRLLDEARDLLSSEQMRALECDLAEIRMALKR